MGGAVNQVIRVEVTLNAGAAARERCMNVWHIGNVGSTNVVDAADDFASALSGFYGAIDAIFSDEMDGLQPVLRAFDLSEPMPRQPIYETSLNTLTAGTDHSARELCVCLSYRGLYISGVSPKRKRGRIYLGPLRGSAVDPATGLLDSSLVSGVVIAGDDLLTDSNGSTEYTWVVYSPTSDPEAGNPLGGAGAPESATLVDRGWVDNEVDVQRRRGRPQPGTKSNFS